MRALASAHEWPLTAGEYVVSGSLSSPLRGAFHLSLTVLVHYRSLKVFSLGGWSPLLPTNSPGFVVLRITTRRAMRLPYGPLTHCGGTFQSLQVRIPRPSVGPTTPPEPKPRWFGLFPPRSPLLRESRLISSRPATEMFQFAGCPSHAYAFSVGCLVITPGGLPHSDSQGSSLVCSSPCTFRRSPRPSSAFSAWASSSYSSPLVVPLVGEPDQHACLLLLVSLSFPLLPSAKLK
jgi:hypothetical protein